MNHDRTPVIPGILLGLGVFVLCLLGILSRPHLDLATFWPANAFMLGMMVRFPRLAGMATWISCAIGFFLADAITGSRLMANLILNGGNLAAIATGFVLFDALPPGDRKLARPMSILYFVRAIVAASFVAGLTGIVANPLLFDGSWKEGFLFWSATELANYMAFLPVLLTLPSLESARWSATRKRLRAIKLADFAPLFALGVSALAGVAIGGPGAVAFPVPALLWCALTYNIFAVSCLAFVFGAWTHLAIYWGLLSVGGGLESRAMLLSTRVGVTLIALTPLVVASVMATRNELLERMRFLADRDMLTGLYNRRAFFENGAEMITPPVAKNAPVVMMMLDIDHFKSINDTYGHDAGDRVLAAFARILEGNVRQGDTVARIGGEEFAVLLPDCPLPEAVSVAERIHDVLRATDITLDRDRAIRVTVSIGVHLERTGENLGHLLACADEALYRAKNGGRDRLELSPGTLAFQSAGLL